MGAGEYQLLAYISTMRLEPTLSNIDVLVYVEDPGAANYIADLPSALTNRSVHSVLLTDGLATNHLHRRGIASRIIKPTDTAFQLINDYEPKLLIVGTSENASSLGLKLITEAKRLGISTIGVIDLKVNADRRFRGQSNSPLAHAPEWLLVPDQATKNSYQSLGFSANRIMVCGHPHYDYVRAAGIQFKQENQYELRRQILPTAPASSPVIVFVAEPPSQLNPDLSLYSSDYNFSGRGNTHYRTEIILQELLDALPLSPVKPYFVLRLHPKNNDKEFIQYKNEIDLASAGGDPLKLIWAADLITGMTSMLLQEAALLGKQTLAVLPRSNERSWLPIIESGITPAVTTQTELWQALTSWGDDWMSGIAKPLPDTSSVFPPGSLEKVVSFVLQQLNGSKTSVLSH